MLQKHNIMLRKLVYNAAHLVRHAIATIMAMVLFPWCITWYIFQIIAYVVETVVYNKLYATIINRMSDNGYKSDISGITFNDLTNIIHAFSFSSEVSNDALLSFKNDNYIIRVKYDYKCYPYYVSVNRIKHNEFAPDLLGYDFPIFNKVLKSGNLIHHVEIVEISSDGIIYAKVNLSKEICGCLFEYCDGECYMVMKEGYGKSTPDRILKLSADERGLLDRAMGAFVADL